MGYKRKGGEKKESEVGSVSPNASGTTAHSTAKRRAQPVSKKKWTRAQRGNELRRQSPGARRLAASWCRVVARRPGGRTPRTRVAGAVQAAGRPPARARVRRRPCF